MTSQFDISSLFEIAFNYRAIPYPAGSLTIGFNYADKYSSLGSALEGKTEFGTPYFLPVKLGGIELPYPLISIQARKRIIETPLVGRRGTVKELINIEDYVISIKGIAIEKDSRFPEFSIQQLKDLYEKNTSLALQCALTDIFLQMDDSIVIRSLDLPDMKGVEHAQAYAMSLVSDSAFDLIIK